MAQSLKTLFSSLREDLIERFGNGCMGTFIGLATGFIAGLATGQLKWALIICTSTGSLLCTMVDSRLNIKEMTTQTLPTNTLD